MGRLGGGELLAFVAASTAGCRAEWHVNALSAKDISLAECFNPSKESANGEEEEQRDEGEVHAGIQARSSDDGATARERLKTRRQAKDEIVA